MQGRYGLMALVALGLVNGSAHPATYYVDANAASDFAKGTQAAPRKTVQGGLALLSSAGGDTLIIAPGTYSKPKDAIRSPTPGKPGAYHVIKAAVDGTVRITSGLELDGDDHYLQFEGLKFDQPDVKVITGRYVKVLRCAFRGGPPLGNNVTLQIGTNDATPGAQHILIEDSWVYGPGGRYKILVYNADKVILRRVLVRHDGGWMFDGSNPQAGIALYDSTNVELQNGLVIDGMAGLPAFESNIYLVANGTTSQRAGNVFVRGTAVIGGGGNGIAWDGSKAYTSSLLEDVVVWGASAGGIAANGAAHVGTINRATVKSGGTAFADWEGNARLTLSNSVAYRNAKSACDGVSASNSVAVGNGANNCGAVFDAQGAGLKYLFRAEPGSRLLTAGANGGPAGATILRRIGVSGSLYGEPGYNQLTEVDLWPWPNEDRIKADLAENDSRGFSASGKSLTRYLWELLGNPSPVRVAESSAATH